MKIRSTQKQLIVGCLLLGAGFLFQATDVIGQVCPPKSVPYLETFEHYTAPDLPPCFDSIDIDGDGKNWQIEYSSGTANSFLRFQRLRPDGINEGLLMLEGIELEQNTTYTFRCLWIALGRKAHPTFRLYMATDKSLDSMLASPPLFDNNAVGQSTFDTLEIDFTPTRSGVYYFGFYGHADDALTQGINISIDDVVVRKKGDLLKDAAVLSIAGLVQGGSFCADDNADVDIFVTNNAILPAKDILLDFTYTGPATGARSHTISSPLQMGETDTITFSGLDLSLTGTYEFTAVITTMGDEVLSNDTLQLTVEVLDVGPDADSITVTSTGGMSFDFGVANPERVFDYNWTFGDGGTGTGSTASHTFSAPGQYTVSLAIGNGCGSKTLTHQLTVEDETDNVIDMGAGTTYTIFPNPVTDRLYIRGEASAAPIIYTLYNSQGKILISGTASGTTEIIDVDEWPQGIYFLQAVHNGHSRVHKIHRMQ